MNRPSGYLKSFNQAWPILKMTQSMYEKFIYIILYDRNKISINFKAKKNYIFSLDQFYETG